MAAPSPSDWPRDESERADRPDGKPIATNCGVRNCPVIRGGLAPSFIARVPLKGDGRPAAAKLMNLKAAHIKPLGGVARRNLADFAAW
jgi:hypothetical protein